MSAVREWKRCVDILRKEQIEFLDGESPPVIKARRLLALCHLKSSAVYFRGICLVLKKEDCHSHKIPEANIPLGLPPLLESTLRYAYSPSSIIFFAQNCQSGFPHLLNSHSLGLRMDI